VPEKPPDDPVSTPPPIPMSSSPLHVLPWFFPAFPNRDCDCKAVESGLWFLVSGFGIRDSGLWTKDGVGQTMQHVTPACPREFCRGHCCRRPLIYWSGGWGGGIQVRFFPHPKAHAFNCRLRQLEIRICQSHISSPHSAHSYLDRNPPLTCVRSLVGLQV